MTSDACGLSSRWVTARRRGAVCAWLRFSLLWLLSLSLMSLLLSLDALAQALQPIPKLESRVTDLTGTLTAEQQAMLEQKLAAFEARKGSQLAVLIVPTTQPEEIEQYSIRVLEQWKLGRKKVDDGALLIIAKNDRALRIEVGYGLEGVLTDATSHRIITEVITPMFREGDFYGGINAGLDRMIRIIDGEPLPPPDQGWQGQYMDHSATGGHHALLPFLFIAVIIGSTVLRALFGRGLGSMLTAAGTGMLVWIGGYALLLAVLAGFAALLFSLFLGSSGRPGWSSYPRYGGSYGGWGGFGGGVGFGRGGSGGGGGFSGGGGGFGGGGASGRW